MLLLAVAYGVLEAGLIDQTLFNPPTLEGAPSDAPAAYIPALGFGASNAVSFIGGHVIWSIGVPIAIVETLVPRRRTSPWLGMIGLTVAGALYLVGSVLIFRFMQRAEQFLATPPQLIGSAAVAAALIVAAFAVGRRAKGGVERRAPRPWLVGVLAFVASSVFFARSESWPGVAFGIALLTVAAIVVGRWSRRADWGIPHRFAMAGGALPTYAWGGFVVLALTGAADTVNLIGQAILVVGVVALLIVGTRTVRRTRDSW